MFFRRLRSQLSAWIVILFVLALLPVGDFAKAEAAAVPPVTEASLDVGSYLDSYWVDNQRGYLYATSTNDNELLFIRLDTFQIEKRLAVGSAPRGIDVVDNKMYVTLSNATFIAVVNLDTKTVERNISTTAKPAQVAVDGNHLFYATGDQWDRIYMLDLTTGNSVLIEDMIHEPRLVADRISHRLYAGETGISRSSLFAYSTLDGSSLWSMESIGGFSSTLLFAEGSIYFSNMQVDPATQRILSTSQTGEYHAVQGNYLYTDLSILNKENGVEVASYGNGFGSYYSDGAVKAVDAAGNVYSYSDSRSSNILYKRSYDLPVSPAAISFDQEPNQIIASRYLTAFAMGKNEKYLYAVSSEANRLLQIDTETFQVVQDRYIGSQPADVDIRDGIIYVALEGSSHIAKIDTQNETNFMAPIIELETGTRTQDIAAGIGKAFYTEPGDWSEVSVYEDVYTTLPGHYSTPSLTLSPDGSSLYVGETDISSGVLYQINTVTGAVYQNSDGFSFNNKFVLLDGNYVYYAAHRLAADNLQTIYGEYKNGYYPAHLIAARGQLVLADNGFYDRDSFNNIFELPFYAEYGYIKEDGTILMYVKSDSDQYYSLLKFDSFDQMKRDIYEPYRPLFGYFSDTNDNAGQIQGDIAIVPGPGAGSVSQYAIRYYDVNNQLISTSFDDTITDWDRTPDLFTGHIYRDLPPGAVKIGIFPMVEKDYRMVTLTEAGLIIRLWDASTFAVDNYAFTDSDTSPSAIGGKVTFDKAPGEIAGDRYVVYFADENDIMGDPIGSVAATGKSRYEIAIPQHTSIPNGAILLALQLEDEDGIGSPGFNIMEIPDTMTIAPKAEQVTMTLNNGASDSLTVTGLKAGDVVKIFDYNFNPVGEQTVAAGQTSANMTNLNLREEAYSYVYLTVTSPGKHESFILILRLTHTAPPTNGNGNGSANPPASGGSSGGGGGGGGIIIPPVGGGGGGGGGAVMPSNPFQAEEVRNTDGTVTINVTLTDASLDSELAKWTDASHTLKLQVEKKGDSLVLSLTSAQLAKLKKANKNAAIHLQGTQSGFVIPAGALEELSSADSYTVQIVPVTGTVSDTINSLLNDWSVKPVGKPFDFKIMKRKPGGALTDISDTQQFIGHIIVLDGTNVPIESLSAVMIDPDTKQVIPVPATFKREGNQIIATVYRKGNSIYSIVSKESAFKDVPAAHFAEQSIKQLASRSVISGYTDGTFKPEGQVTRAEAAVLLTKALGIAPASNPVSFKDVSSNAWYHDAVSAAVQAGLFKGYSDGTFRPSQFITQQEMAAILYQALLYGGYALNSSGDAQQFDSSAGYSAWSAQAVDTLLREGIMKKADSFPIQANKQTTRAETAELLYRMLKSLELI